MAAKITEDSLKEICNECDGRGQWTEMGYYVDEDGNERDGEADAYCPFCEGRGYYTKPILEVIREAKQKVTETTNE